MADRRPKPVPGTVRARLRRIPGLVTSIRRLRALSTQILIALIERALAWSQRNPQRRALMFAALSDPLAFAQHSRESYVVHTADKIIGRSLYARGQFDFQKFETACRLIRAHAGPASDAILIDAGANIGSICIPAVKRGFVARAIAIELDPDNVRLLRVNAILNGVDDRIDIRNMAVGATRSQVSIRRSASNYGDHRVLAVTQPSLQASGMSVDMIPLDSVAVGLDLHKTILWMDVQGYEAYALQGANCFIEAGAPLITEFSPKELGSFDSCETFLSVITASGYGAFYDLNAAQPEALSVNRTALQALCDKLEQHNTFTDLLFLPGHAS